METTEKLTNLQLELLKIFSVKMSEEELLEVKQVLVNHFQSKFDNEMDKLWMERGWTQNTMEQWLHEHNRASKK